MLCILGPQVWPASFGAARLVTHATGWQGVHSLALCGTCNYLFQEVRGGATRVDM